MKKKKRMKKGFKAFLIIIVFLPILLASMYFLYKEVIVPKYSKNIEVLDIYLDNENVKVSLSEDAKCSLEQLDISSDKWIQSEKGVCSFDFVDKVEGVYTLDNYNRVVKHDIKNEFSIVDNIEITKEKLYLAKGAKEKIEYKVSVKGSVTDKVEFKSSNEEVATVDSDGNVAGVSDGEADIIVYIRDKEKSVHVIVTSLITAMPDQPSVTKTLLPCGIYTEEDNNLLDEILRDRVYSAGYKTRAGAVAAARFLGLEFPYRIAYFSENGRMSGSPKVDGEGRYYHEGLYLNSSRYDRITDIMYGPVIWGCPMYSVPTLKAISNGLDCSGFITWILRQAGFETGDLGAGVSPGIDDMTDLGPKGYLYEAVDEGRVKVGDLLSGNGETTNAWDGGHIAFVAGIENGNYYVAEEMWFGTGYFGAIIRKYTTEQFKYYFYWHIDMENFYEGNGTIGDYWTEL